MPGDTHHYYDIFKKSVYFVKYIEAGFFCKEKLTILYNQWRGRI